MAAPPPTRKFTLFHLALLVPFIAIAVNAFERISDNSYLWHVRAGTLQIDTGAVLTADPFSFTMNGEPWLTQSWLVELLYGWLETTFGITFTGHMVLVTSGITMVGLGLLAFKYSKSVPATSIVLILSTIMLGSFLVPRPVLFSYPLFVLVILAWENRRLRWSVPFLFWLWAAIHGSFIIGLAYVVLRTIQKREWKAIVVVFVSGLTTLMTAHGLGVLEMLWSFAEARQYLSLISEWRTPNFLSIDMAPLLIGICLIVYGASKGRIRSTALWIFVPFLFLAVSAERSVGSAWIALVPLVSMSLEGMSVRRVRGFPTPIAVVFAVVILVLPFLFAEATVVDDEKFPVEAVEALKDVRTFHDDYVGGYLIWSAGPQTQVYIDDRAELYQERTEEFVNLRAARADWQEPFAEDGIEQVLLRPDDPLVRLLEAEGWSESYGDEAYVILRPSN